MVALWPSVDECPDVSGKLPSVFTRDELKLYAVLRLNLRLIACVTRTFTTSVLVGTLRLKEKILHGARKIRRRNISQETWPQQD